MKLPRTRTIVILSALATTAAIAAGGATAQQRHNSNAPIDFAAQNIELQDRANRAILSGGVKITQSNMTLDANRVTVAYTGAVLDGNPQVSRLDAAGGVTVDLKTRQMQSAGRVTGSTPMGNFSGDRMRADLEERNVRLEGNARLRIYPGRTN